MNLVEILVLLLLIFKNACSLEFPKFKSALKLPENLIDHLSPLINNLTVLQTATITNLNATSPLSPTRQTSKIFNPSDLKFSARH